MHPKFELVRFKLVTCRFIWKDSFETGSSRAHVGCGLGRSKLY